MAKVDNSETRMWKCLLNSYCSLQYDQNLTDVGQKRSPRWWPGRKTSAARNETDKPDWLQCAETEGVGPCKPAPDTVPAGLGNPTR
jgi:hypothetical protein